jgi:hypothetical protein
MIRGVTPRLGPSPDLDGVLERMADLDRALPRDDGVAVFNRMYFAVTRHIDDAIDRSVFIAGDFIPRLDVVFANHFFAACDADARGEAIPDAWQPLFRHREKPRTYPIQFAMAGMNAHISHDLCLSVIDACHDFGAEPRGDSAEHGDYTEVNRVLAVAEEEIKSWFSTGIVATLDDAGGRVDDAFAMFAIHLARAAAWEVAETMWALADNPRLLRMVTGALQLTVRLTSEGILL